MIFVVRHGERADQAYDQTLLNIELKYDPPLTEIGKAQSLKTGNKIRSLVEEGYHKGLINTPNPQYVVVSSPFLRCLQTAYHMLEAFGKESIYENTIFYEEGLCEFLKEGAFDNETLKNLIIRQRTKDEIQKNIPYKIREGLVQEQEHFVSPKYPETALLGYDRVEACYSKLVDHFMKNLNSNGDKVLIIVTHAFAVYSILRIHLPLFLYDKGTEFGTFNQIIYDEKARGKGRVLEKLYTDHIFDNSVKPKL